MTGPRVTVLGAGLVGACCAWSLAGAGAAVRVIDPGAGRAAASWAAAGILSPSHPELLPDALHDLGDRSLELWGDLAARHPAVELRRTGQVLLGDEPAWLAWRERRGRPTRAITWGGEPAHCFPEVGVVRAHRAAPALLADAGVEAERAPAPPLDALRAGCDVVVIATGAWAAPHLAEAGLSLQVSPRRGQMMLFAAGDLPAVLIEGGREGVAVPRADGRVVAGTTLEDAGFDASTVDADLDRLEGWARERIPGLGPREDAWAGFRPWSPRPAPTIGWVAPGVIAAVGHFRNGVLLGPATGEMVAGLVTGRAPRVDPAPFAP
ncbi:MAG: NAD(P)/FAD-dependent oxidoreductase [Thermoleophilia bacterium]